MRKTLYGALGCISALAGLASLPYLFMSMHELLDALRGQLDPDVPKWDPYIGVGLFGTLSFGAFFMTFRVFQYVFSIKTTD